MADPTSALGWDGPDVKGHRQELIGQHRGLVREIACRPLGHGEAAIEPTLAGHDHTLGQVTEHGVRGRAIGPPGAGAAGALGLLPDDLASQEQAEVVLEDPGDVSSQAPEGAAAEVGDVDGDAPTGLEHPHTLGKDLGEHLEVLEVGGGDALGGKLLLVGLAGEVGRRGDDQGD